MIKEAGLSNILKSTSVEVDGQAEVFASGTGLGDGVVMSATVLLIGRMANVTLEAVT